MFRKKKKKQNRSNLAAMGLRSRAVVLSGVLAANGAVRPVWADLLGLRLFPPDNAWRQNIANAPVSLNSAAIIARIGAGTRLTPNWYADNPGNGSSPLYGIPYNVVHGNSTNKVNVIIDNYPGESDMVAAPIPANAVLEGDFQNGPNPNGGGYNPNQRGDSHLIVWDEDNNIGYEFFGVTRPDDPTLFPNTSNVELPHTDGLWHAAQETVWNFNKDSFRTLGETSADAAGLSILAGLARPDEGLTVAQGGQGVINHALRVTLPSGDLNPQYVYPASHMVSTSPGPDNVPLGTRLRLANTQVVNTLINSMPPQSQVLARAMQQYGLIVTDIGNAMYVSGAPASVDANNSISQVWDLTDIFAANGLEALNAGDFEVVNLTPIVSGLSSNSGAAGSLLTITGQNFSGAAGYLSVSFGGTAATSVTVIGDNKLSVTVPSSSGTVDVTVQSGLNEVDNLSSNPNANVNAPIFGYGTSAVTAADKFTFTANTAPATVVNVSSTTANGTYGTGANIAVTVTFSKPVNVTGVPQLFLNSGGMASYTFGSGTSTLTFSYVVAAGQNSAALDANSSSALTLNGGTIDDSSSTAANLTLPAPGAPFSLSANKSIVIDTTPPAVVSYSVDFGSEAYNLMAASRTTHLPWSVTGVTATFSKPIATATAASLNGITAAILSGIGTTSLTWTFSPITNATLSTGLAGSGANAIKDAAGNSLAGGAGFTQGLSILYGDFNGDGVVTAADLVGDNLATKLAYNVLADINGDGVVNATDVTIVKTQQGASQH